MVGRKPINGEPMTAVERQRRRRDRLRQERQLLVLRRAWEACTKSQRSQFLRELRAGQLAIKQARRAAREKAMAEGVMDDDPPAGWTGAGPRSPDRPQFRCPRCSGWNWWRLRGSPWSCLECDPCDGGELDLTRVEFANTLRASDGFAIPPTPAQ